MRAALKTLRTDIDAGQLESFAQRVHADLLSDLMAQAEYLTGEGFRQAACVMAGGVLEQHIRLLATKYGLALTNPRGEAVKTSMLNDQLQSTANAYGKADQAQVSAWLKMRNDAAHGVAGFETTYNEGDLRRMCEGVRAFVIKYPA